MTIKCEHAKNGECPHYLLIERGHYGNVKFCCLYMDTLKKLHSYCMSKENKQ